MISDVLAEIQNKTIADCLKNSDAGEKQLTETLDKMLDKINKDLQGVREAQAAVIPESNICKKRGRKKPPRFRLSKKAPILFRQL